MPRSRRNEPLTQSLTAFLLKTGTKDYMDALEDVDQLDQHELSNSVPFEGVIFLARQRQTPPAWLPFLQEGAEARLGNLFNASNSAVLFVRAMRRLFAFTFGYGRSLLAPERIERSFGLRVVLNTVDEQCLRSVDTKTIQELTVHTRRQTSRASSLTEFGIDKEEDLLGSVAGAPRDPNFAKLVSGSDAIQFRAPIDFNRLGNKCQDLLRAYRQNDYKNRGFAFVDHVRAINDPSLVRALDDDLLEALSNGDPINIHMAPPEIIDWDSTEGFSFTKNKDPEVDLRLDAFFSQIQHPEELSIDRLNRQRVYHHIRNAPSPVRRWPVYRVLLTEFDRTNTRYVLSGGQWYEVEKSFAQQIANRLNRIRLANIQLPNADDGEHEGTYNSRAAKRRGIYCIDKKCPRVDGDEIEICDLYTSQRQFIHVKRWTASSTLSHLFAQGRVSAETFIYDAAFRNGVRDVLKECSPSLAAHVPQSRPNPSRYQIVYAIIKGGTNGWKRSLPFFSQLHLVRSAESLRRIGFDVRLKRINIS